MFPVVVKRSLFLPFHLKLLWLLPCCLLGAFFFWGAHLAQGASVQAKQSVHRYYEGHATVNQSAYRPESPMDISSWWRFDDGSFQILNTQDFVRGYSRRTKLPAFLITGKERVPVELILVDDTDNNVFSLAVFPETQFQENTVTLGIGLAVKHGIETDASLTLEVPALGTSFSNQRVARIFNQPEVTLQNHTIFMNSRTASAYTGNAMRSYHVRFDASPFAGLLISNVQPLIPNARFRAATQSISYALHTLEQAKILLFWGYLAVNFLGGVLLAFGMFLYGAQREKQMYSHCRLAGLSPPKTAGPLMIEYIKGAVFTGIFAGILSLIFEKLPFEFLIFSPFTGLYPEFSLKVSQGIVALVDYPFLLKSLPVGVIVFVISAWGSRLLIAFFQKEGHGMNALASLLVILFFSSYVFSRFLIQLSYAQSARNSLLAEHYFGDYILQDQYADQARSFNLPPNPFTVPKDFQDALEQQTERAFGRLETLGEIVQVVAINAENSLTNRISVNYLGLKGSVPAELKEVFNATESGRIVVGQNIANAFPDVGVLSFLIYGAESNIMVSLPVDIRENFDIPAYNNYVFFNTDILAAYMGIPENSLTSLLIFGRNPAQYLDVQANPQLVLSPFKKQKNLLTSLEKPIFFICWIIFLTGIGGLVVLLAACFTAASVFYKESAVYTMIWGEDFPAELSYFTAAAAFFVGGFSASLSLLSALVISGPLPSVLSLGAYTPALLTYRINAFVLFLIPLVELLIALLGWRLVKIFSKNFYRQSLARPDRFQENIE